MPHLFGRDWTRADLERQVGSLAQIFGVEAAEYTDGPARGMRFLEVRSGGGLRFILHPDRALDIGLAEFEGVPLAWRSAVGPIRPGLAGGDDRTAFQRNFGGGLLMTCGLRHFGPPLTTEEEQFPPHGRIHGLPAENVRWGTEWTGDDAVLWVGGTMREVRTGGEYVELQRRYEVPVGGAEVRLTDTVVNRGYRPEPLAVLYHINLGFPLIGRDVTVLVGQEMLTLPDKPATVQRPTPGGGAVAVRSPVFPWGARLAFTHPSVYVWRQPDPGMNVLAIEPATHGEMGRPQPGEPWLQPGEYARSELALSISR